MISARYDSRCVCDRWIREGDPIGVVDGEWVCEECVEEMGEDALTEEEYLDVLERQ